MPPALSCSSYHSMLRDLGRKADSSAEAYSAFLLFSCFCLTDKRWANLERLLSDLGKGRGKALMSLQHPGARGPPDAGGCEGHRGALGGPAAPGWGSTSLGEPAEAAGTRAAPASCSTRTAEHRAREAKRGGRAGCCQPQPCHTCPQPWGAPAPSLLAAQPLPSPLAWAGRGKNLSSSSSSSSAVGRGHRDIAHRRPAPPTTARHQSRCFCSPESRPASAVQNTS